MYKAFTIATQDKIFTPTLIESEDGSHTLFVPELDEHYHSIHGAIQESKHVFIETGLKALPENLKEINILEIGFGTGLNAFLTLLIAEETGKKINYTGLELYPLPAEIAAKLNYASILAPDKENLFRALHQIPWEKNDNITENFTFQKLNTSASDIDFKNTFHLVYFDAFAPEKQPELWSTEVFKKMHDALLPGGILVTYCAKGQVRRNMLEAGFIVERLPGPPHKREMLRARK